MLCPMVSVVGISFRVGQSVMSAAVRNMPQFMTGKGKSRGLLGWFKVGFVIYSVYVGQKQQCFVST